MTETTALGAAIAAGCAEGIKIWDLNKVQPTPSDTFHPLISTNGINLIRICCGHFERNY